MKSRFFAEGTRNVGEGVELHGADARKIRLVLRKRSGDRVVVCDSTGRAFSATLEIADERVIARLDEVLEEASETHLRIALAQGVPKGSKMDYVIEKATELGVARILPLVTERTPADVGAAKLERWQRLARSAAQQSGRSRVPAIEAPLRWGALVARFGEFDRTLVPWELAPRTPLRERLPALVDKPVTNVLVVIGPEGGLSHAETSAAEAAGAELISLGGRILRTETAGLVVCSAVLYARGEL